MTKTAEIIHVVIGASAEAVHDFVADPENIARWAPNFGDAISRTQDGWVVATPEGPYQIRFSEPNTLGVLDHWVISPTGEEFYNPIRVVPNGDGSLFSFTLFQHASWSDEKFSGDIQLVRGDLARLKQLLESGAGTKAPSV
ncbi:SRPBCC family protein [Altericroceibacterium xinjiangense]|uniref:SRPBCC family protein n=1 Tax=Altericroceibacterium xinjiangense TaxID=762261 RepID=UPI000F7E0AE7|nr:SRPBCC family protein [Altericroceibacterium xinjiangense]